jgi:ketosteroid isomerase-like protein
VRYTIVEAEMHKAAARMFHNHPTFPSSLVTPLRSLGAGHRSPDTLKGLKHMSCAIRAFAVFGLMLVAVPLLAQHTPEPSMSTELPDTALPPDLDRVLRDYERAWRAGDAKAIASLFTENGVLLQNNRPPIRGRPAIQATYEGERGGPLRLRALAFAAGDTVGYIVGGYRYGDALQDMGKFTITLERAPGKAWLISSDMDSMNASPKPRQAPDTPAPNKTPIAEH